jgi:hypothetical protein
MKIDISNTGHMQAGNPSVSSILKHLPPYRKKKFLRMEELCHPSDYLKAGTLVETRSPTP